VTEAFSSTQLAFKSPLSPLIFNLRFVQPFDFLFSGCKQTKVRKILLLLLVLLKMPGMCAYPCFLSGVAVHFPYVYNKEGY